MTVTATFCVCVCVNNKMACVDAGVQYETMLEDRFCLRHGFFKQRIVGHLLESESQSVGGSQTENKLRRKKEKEPDTNKQKAQSQTRMNNLESLLTVVNR